MAWLNSRLAFSSECKLGSFRDHESSKASSMESANGAMLGDSQIFIGVRRSLDSGGQQIGAK
jgi:hypothetical protein